ncbi:MAG: hypothetical protein FJ271_17895 [Planctomycetes bacterium]|nr:hypothetical protein [Planctomycetota bacterium]
MSASTHDPANEDSAQVDLGGRLLVLGLMLMLVIESLLATAALIQLSFVHVVIGIVSICVALYLSNWIYTGDRPARKVLLGWTGLQIFLAGGAVLAYFAAHGEHESMRVFGIAAPTNGTAISLAVVKLGCYLFLGYLLSQSASVKNFLRVKAGREPHAIEPASIAPSGVVVATADKDKRAVAEVGTWMQATGLILIVAGLLSVIAGARHASRIYLIEGALIAVLGAVMLGPVGVLRQLSPDQLDRAFLLSAFGQLKALYKKQVAILGGLAIVAVVMLVMLFR